MTIPSPGHSSIPTTSPGRRVAFWYQATRYARAEASCRYRIGNVVELLRGATSLVDPRPSLRAFDGARLLVVVRPYLDASGLQFLRTLRRRDVMLVADFDDHLFDGDPNVAPLVVSGALTPQQYAARIAQCRAALGEFAAYTVSTPHLAMRLRSILPNSDVTVVPNGVSPLWIAQGRAQYQPWAPGHPRVIRYLVGSPTHDADMTLVLRPLAQFLRSHPRVRLEVVGPLRFEREALPVSQVSQIGAVPFGELPRLLASSWVTLAPLAHTEFNWCRSAIKFLESAAFGAPCVASPNSDMLRHAAGGVILAETDKDWVDALTRLKNDEYRMTLSERGRAHVDKHGSARHTVERFLECLAKWGNERPDVLS